jgi:hypothetical protein
MHPILARPTPHGLDNRTLHDLLPILSATHPFYRHRENILDAATYATGTSSFLATGVFQIESQQSFFCEQLSPPIGVFA